MKIKKLIPIALVLIILLNIILPILKAYAIEIINQNSEKFSKISSLYSNVDDSDNAESQVSDIVEEDPESNKAPDDPKFADLYDAFGVIIKCTTDIALRSHVTKTEYQYDQVLAGGTYTGNRTDDYTYVVTLHSKKYVEDFIALSSINCSHTPADDVQTVTLKYIDGTWVATQASKSFVNSDGKKYVEFNVECSEKKIQSYTYELTWDYNGGTNATYGDSYFETQTNTTGTAYFYDQSKYKPTKSGYTFNGWEYSGNGTYTRSNGMVVMYGEAGETVSGTLMAKWVEANQSNNASYTVSWFEKATGDTIKPTETRYAVAGNPVSVTGNPGDKGVDGWTYDPNDRRNVESAILAADGSTALKLYFDRNDETVEVQPEVEYCDCDCTQGHVCFCRVGTGNICEKCGKVCGGKNCFCWHHNVHYSDSSRTLRNGKVIEENGWIDVYIQRTMGTQNFQHTVKHARDWSHSSNLLGTLRLSKFLGWDVGGVAKDGGPIEWNETGKAGTKVEYEYGYRFSNMDYDDLYLYAVWGPCTCKDDECNCGGLEPWCPTCGGNCNNTCCVQSEPEPEITYNISATKKASQEVVESGDTIEYTVVITNNGEGTLHDLTITDVMPDSITFSGIIDGPDKDKGLITSSSEHGYTWKMKGNLEASETITLRYNTIGTNTIKENINLTNTVEAVAYKGAEKVNDDNTLETIAAHSFQHRMSNFSNTRLANLNAIATIRGSVSGSDSSSVTVTGTDTVKDSASATVTVKPYSYALSITKSADVTSVKNGDSIAYTVDIINSGTGILHNLSVTDTIPDELNLTGNVNSSVDGETEFNNKGYIWTMNGDFKPNDNITLTYTTIATNNNDHIIELESSVTATAKTDNPNETVNDEDKIIVTVDAPIKHIVTFVPDNGEPNFTETIEHGESVDKPTDPKAKEGYEFEGWFSEDGKEWDFDNEVNEDITLTAKWKKVQHTVTFVPDNGEPNFTETVEHGESVNKPADPKAKEGYEFEGWFTEDGKEWNFDNEINGDLTLIAKWKEVKHNNSIEDSAQNNNPTSNDVAPSLNNSKDISSTTGSISKSNTTNTKNTSFLPLTGDKTPVMAGITIAIVILLNMVQIKIIRLKKRKYMSRINIKYKH